MKSPIVVILLDALGFTLTERLGFHADGLSHRMKLRTVPGFSQSALSTIFTGTPPDKHGLWMMYSFSRDRSPLRWLSLIPAGVSGKRLWLRRLINWKLRNIDEIRSYYNLYDIPRNVMPYLDIPAKRNIFMPEESARINTVIDELYRRGLRLFIRDYHTPEKTAFDQLEDALRKSEADFYLLYTAELDADLHKYGTTHENVKNHLKWYSKRLEKLLSINNGVKMLVFGDHGMCDVHGSVDIIKLIESLDLKIPRDYIPFYDSTIARFKVFSEKAEIAIKNKLSELSSGVVLDSAERIRLAIDYEDKSYGDIIFLLNEGEIILPSYMSDSPVKGMHGYHPDNECMYSALYTNADFGAENGSIMDISDFILPGFKSEKKV